jgi:hypothetical protein
VKLAWKASARDAARVGGWGMAVYAGVQLLGRLFEHNTTGALGAQFVLAEFGLGKLGVAWSDPLLPVPTTRDLVNRALRGASYGATAAAALIAAGLVSHQLTRANTSPSMAPLLLGILIAAATAARDELLLRGLPLRALKSLRADRWSLVFIGLVGACSRLGADDAHPRNVIFAAASAVALGGLWLRDRGAWLAWSANMAFLFVTGPVARGGLVDLRTESGDLRTTLSALAVTSFFAIVSALPILRPRPPARAPDP